MSEYSSGAVQDYGHGHPRKRGSHREPWIAEVIKCSCRQTEKSATGEEVAVHEKKPAEHLARVQRFPPDAATRSYQLNCSAILRFSKRFPTLRFLVNTGTLFHFSGPEIKWNKWTLVLC